MAKKYTFEDWVSGNIPEPPYPNDGGSRDEWDKVWGADREDNWVFYWQYNPPHSPRITGEVAETIKQAQKYALEQAIDRNIGYLIQLFIKDCQDTPREEMPDVIEMEIETQKQILKRTGLLRYVKQRKLNYSFITPDIYHEMQEDDYFEFFIESVRLDDGNTYRRVPERFELFHAYQTYMLIKKFESLLANYKNGPKKEETKVHKSDIQNQKRKGSENQSEKIDGTAKRCIRLFLNETQFIRDNDKAAEAFLMSFEIRAKEEFGEVTLGNVAPTVNKVLNHKSFIYEGNVPGKRTLQKYLTNYWCNYRSPNRN